MPHFINVHVHRFTILTCSSTSMFPLPHWTSPCVLELLNDQCHIFWTFMCIDSTFWLAVQLLCFVSHHLISNWMPCFILKFMFWLAIAGQLVCLLIRVKQHLTSRHWTSNITSSQTLVLQCWSLMLQCAVWSSSKRSDHCHFSRSVSLLNFDTHGIRVCKQAAREMRHQGPSKVDRMNFVHDYCYYMKFWNLCSENGNGSMCSWDGIQMCKLFKIHAISMK